MPRFTQHCLICDWSDDIFAAPFENPPCPTCGGASERLWVGEAASVCDDTYIGGKTFENLGHEPVTVHSRSELKRVMRERGLQECVRHVPVPGTDKSPHTTSWAAVSPYQLQAATEMVSRMGRVTPSAQAEPSVVGPEVTDEMLSEIFPL